MVGAAQARLQVTAMSARRRLQRERASRGSGAPLSTLHGTERGRSPALLHFAGTATTPAVPGATLDIQRERTVGGINTLVRAGRQRAAKTSLLAATERRSRVVRFELGQAENGSIVDHGVASRKR